MMTIVLAIMRVIFGIAHRLRLAAHTLIDPERSNLILGWVVGAAAVIGAAVHFFELPYWSLVALNLFAIAVVAVSVPPRTFHGYMLASYGGLSVGRPVLSAYASNRMPFFMDGEFDTFHCLDESAEKLIARALAAGRAHHFEDQQKIYGLLFDRLSQAGDERTRRAAAIALFAQGRALKRGGNLNQAYGRFFLVVHLYRPDESPSVRRISNFAANIIVKDLGRKVSD